MIGIEFYFTQMWYAIWYDMNLISIIFPLKPEGRRIEMTKVISLEASGSTDIPPVEVSFSPSAVKGSKAVYALVMGR